MVEQRFRENAKPRPHLRSTKNDKFVTSIISTVKICPRVWINTHEHYEAVRAEPGVKHIIHQGEQS